MIFAKIWTSIVYKTIQIFTDIRYFCYARTTYDKHDVKFLRVSEKPKQLYPRKT